MSQRSFSTTLPRNESRRSGPACGTCRRKCRKCDRARPSCTRCIVKGLVCEGYPTTFKIYDANVGHKAASKVRKGPKKARKSRSSIHLESISLEAPVNPSESPEANDQSTYSNSPNGPSPDSEASPPGMSQIANVLAQEEVQDLLTYFETIICEALSTPSSLHPNPFRTHVLPLAYLDLGLLNAVLGLSACHWAAAKQLNTNHMSTAALQHRLVAIQSLSDLLIKEEVYGLNEMEEEITLTIVLTLVLHDICESGKSMHGAHLNGATFLCSRIATNLRLQNQRRTFLVAALTWFDLLRGFSGAEKLAFTPEIRRFVYEAAESNLETLMGCPAEIFLILGDIISAGKRYWHRELPTEDFQPMLDQAEQKLRAWAWHPGLYSGNNPELVLLAEAHRHTAILRVLRWPDPFEVPCTDPRVKESVDAILDACSKVSWDSPFFKRLLFPLFVAGADTVSLHQQHYVTLCIDSIRRATGFPHPSLSELLDNTWNDRNASDGMSNVPWMEYTCSAHLERQHDFLFF